MIVGGVPGADRGVRESVNIRWFPRASIRRTGVPTRFISGVGWRRGVGAGAGSRGREGRAGRGRPVLDFISTPIAPRVQSTLGRDRECRVSPPTLRPKNQLFTARKQLRLGGGRGQQSIVIDPHPNATRTRTS